MAAQRNAVRFVPQFDDDVQAVTAPTIPAPFVNPPIVLRSVALINDATLFANDFRYHEATNMSSLVPRFVVPAGRRRRCRCSGRRRRRWQHRWPT